MKQKMGMGIENPVGDDPFYNPVTTKKICDIGTVGDRRTEIIVFVQ